MEELITEESHEAQTEYRNLKTQVILIYEDAIETEALKTFKGITNKITC